MKKDVAKLGLCVGLLCGVAYCLYCIDKVIHLELDTFEASDDEFEDEDKF